jgi:predicted nuclease with RNAse H fold
MATPALLGVDVGFSESKKTTGLAWFAGSTIETALTGSSWEERSHSLPRDVQFAIAALDAPIVPAEKRNAFRGCERAFYGGAFWNRCRPGLSHHGRRGLALRDAGRQAAQDFSTVLTAVALPFGPSVFPMKPIIEAFPNAFMGVLLPAAAFAGWNKSLGKTKSDWLYERVVEAGLFRKLLSKLNLASPSIQRKFEEAQHHDERAALICLLTAMFARSGDAVIVGDTDGGWFWLPPNSLWDPWASAALELALRPSPKNRFPLTGHWKNDVLEVQAP